jgi:hypothetical protein
MMAAARLGTARREVSKHPDTMMTPAQIARRKFKSSLPRKPQDRRLSAMEALGEVFTLFVRLRDLVSEEGLDPDTVHAGLAYYLPASDPALVGAALPLPDPSRVAEFCREVTALDRPEFLGVVFIQVDTDPEVNPAYKTVSFCAPFVNGPEEQGRLLVAQKVYLMNVQKILEKVARKR